MDFLFYLYSGLEINSANIKRWIREEDLEKLEGAVLEGYGEKVASQKSDNAKLQKYITDQVRSKTLNY